MLNDRPLVSFVIISFNHERFIGEAVESALAQTYSPLEVVISDDSSKDATFAIIEKIVANYRGPHKVIIHKNARNLGLAGNVNKVWELSSGELVVFQGGDDISLPHRTSRLVEAWTARTPRPDLVYSGVVLIDEEGKVISENTKVVEKTPPIDGSLTGRNTFVAGGCAAAYARPLHFLVGPLIPDVMAEDFVYSFRALLGNGVAGISEPLVLYRQHTTSIMAVFKDDTEANRRLSGRYLKGQVAKLIEYKKAMDAYQVKRPYLRWRLNRRINSFSMELHFDNTGTFNKWVLVLCALSSLRFRVVKYMVSTLTSSARY